MLLTGEHAEPKAAYYYDAYGMVYGEHPPQGIPRPAVPQVARPAVERGTEYLYTGKRFDPETGLADYGFRDYAASLARFTTMDPIRDGRNWFAYVEGDPVNKIDLWGLETASDGEAASSRSEILPLFEFGADPFAVQNETSRRVSNKAVGIGVMIVGGVGLFSRGGTSAAILMAGGAILYTTPDDDPRSAFRIVADSMAGMFTPAVLPLSDALQADLERELGPGAPNDER